MKFKNAINVVCDGVKYTVKKFKKKFEQQFTAQLEWKASITLPNVSLSDVVKEKSPKPKTDKKTGKETPGIKYPGDDPTVSPGKGWEWRGPSDKGSWYNPKTGESLRPDLNHPEPIGPHWDYKDSNGIWHRVNPDGTLAPKH